jgi:2-oxo-4-hydroxy-4-carboxy--5-ureidoimidazoline (OHCU) decarboxylase
MEQPEHTNKITVTFNTDANMTAERLHEALCKVIHEGQAIQSEDAFAINDIDIVDTERIYPIESPERPLIRVNLGIDFAVTQEEASRLLDPNTTYTDKWNMPTLLLLQEALRPLCTTNPNTKSDLVGYQLNQIEPGKPTLI